jgi:hypothetical protein
LLPPVELPGIRRGRFDDAAYKQTVCDVYSCGIPGQITPRTLQNLQPTKEPVGDPAQRGQRWRAIPSHGLQ